MGAVSMPGRVPVTIIGGFLGVGKTTFVNHLLSQNQGKRYTVFVNDFGEINIDMQLIDTIRADRISFKNGCVCCTLNDELAAQLARTVRSATPPQAVLIEASGLSDQRAIDKTLIELETAGFLRRDARVHVLDVSNFESYDFDDAEAVLDQCAVSDFVLLNKIDLASDAQLASVHATLKDSATHAVVIETSRCAVPADLLAIELTEQSATPERNPEPSYRDQSDRLANFASWSFSTNRLLDRSAFTEFLPLLGEQCFRAKGMIRFQDSPESLNVFHLVGKQVSLENRGVPDHVYSLRPTRLVAIGKKDYLSEKILAEAIERACIQPKLD